VQELLERLGPAAGLRQDNAGWEVPLDGVPARLWVEGKLLWFSTDASALEGLRNAPREAGRPAVSGLYARLDGKAAARALSRLSILDLLRSPDLSGLVLAGTELGPLLDMTRAVEVELRAGANASVHFSARWTLEPP
jgi:hypothetical protein